MKTFTMTTFYKDNISHGCRKLSKTGGLFKLSEHIPMKLQLKLGGSSPPAPFFRYCSRRKKWENSHLTYVVGVETSVEFEISCIFILAILRPYMWCILVIMQ